MSTLPVDADLLARLRQAAETARAMTWNPYSGYTVLAAIETVDGRVYGGSNVENATWCFRPPIDSCLSVVTEEACYA